MADNKNENMIFIYDVFTDIYKDESLRLSPNELYLYCYLYRRRNYDQFVETTIDSIHQLAPVKFYPSVESKNRKMVKDALLSLRNKGIISFDCERDVYDSRKGNSVPLHITFNQFTDNSGHLRIPYSDCDAAQDINYFYIRVAVERFNNVKTLGRHSGRWISDKEFGYLLGVSKRTFRNYADDMISKGLLYKVSGERHNSMEQDKNVYRTIPFENVDGKKIKASYKDKDYPVGLEINTVIGEYKVEDIKIYLDHCNWGRKDAFGLYLQLEQDDYNAFRTCDELNIHKRKVEMIKNTIENIKSYSNYDGMFEKFEKEYLIEKDKLAVT